MMNDQLLNFYAEELSALKASHNHRQLQRLKHQG